MYCSSCGAKIPDDSKFCFNCGARAGSFDLSRFTPPPPQTKFTPAKCTNCGASLTVDPSQKAAVCPFCNSAYIVEKAIQEYNIQVSGNLTVNGAQININGKNLDNLLERAEQCASSGDFDKAMDYFNEVLDSDISSERANRGIHKIKNILNDYVYMSEKTGKGLLELKKGRLILTTNVNPQLYELDRIFGVEIVKKGFFSSEKLLQFTYSGIPQRRITLETSNANKGFIAIEDAKMGKYPKMIDLGSLYTSRDF